jgi:hypothetical protein
VSDRRAWARKTLAAAAADLGALSWWKDNDAYQTALANIRDGVEVEETLAQFGGDQIPIMPRFPAGLLSQRAIEMALGLMMFKTASAMADPICAQPVLTKDVIAKREELEKNVTRALSLEPYDESAERERDEYVAKHRLLLAIQASLNGDPIVEQRRPTRRKPDVSVADEDRARAVRARIRELARRIFGKAGDRVADVFVTAATGVEFSRDDWRVHLSRKRSRRLELSDGRPAGRQTDRK